MGVDDNHCSSKGRKSSDERSPNSSGILHSDGEADEEGRMLRTNDAQNKWPEEPEFDSRQCSLSSSLHMVYKRWTYCYMNKILRKGSAAAAADTTPRLVQEDLFLVPTTMKAERVSGLFWRCYYNEKMRATPGQRRLFSTLFRIALPTFIPAGVCQLITVIVQVAMPLLVRQLLMVLEENPSENVVSQGMPYAVGVFITLFVNAFASHRHRHLAMETGIVMRAALVSIIYERVLNLTPRGRVALTSGEVASLISVDAQKIFEVAQEAHLIWSLPLSIILVTVFLILIMGPVALVGIFVLLLFVPVVERITSRMLIVRQTRVRWTDKRVDSVNAMLQGIKVTKLNNYEEKYEKLVADVRRKEIACLKKELSIWASTQFIMVVSPVLCTAATFAVYVLVDETNILTASLSFSVLLLFSALRFPINYAGRLIGRAAQALSALQRISGFLQRETRGEFSLTNENVSLSRGAKSSSDGPTLTLTSASFCVGSSCQDLLTISELGNTTSTTTTTTTTKLDSFTVSEFNFSLQAGEVLAVVGPVGSGKSCLINGIIDEVPAASPESLVMIKGTVAYVPQIPFILNTTLRENILFGLPFEQELYNKVLEACCLNPDLDQLGEAKDLTEIGERGVTLSGGQKQRVSLARAAYSRPDLILMDDPLSALDAGTAKMVFERLIKSPNAFLSNTAVILVTHASHFLNRVDQLMIIVNGQNKFIGTWGDLAKYESGDPKTKGAIEFIRNSVQEEHSGEDATDTEESDERNSVLGKTQTKTLMVIEEREHGLSSLKTWLLWFRYAGGLWFLGSLAFFLAIDRFMYVATEYWLAKWTEGAYSSIEAFGINFAPQTDGRSAQYMYLLVYLVIIVVSFLATYTRSVWAVKGGARTARAVFIAMLSSILLAPITYFETNPTGRILNRFTFDMEVIDVVLTQNMSLIMISCGWFLAGLIVMLVILPYVAFVVVPITILYWMMLFYYRKSATDLQRLDAVSRSPIQAMVTEGLDGASTIRVFEKEQCFIDRFHSKVDTNSSALLNFVTTQRWLQLRIEVLGSIVVLVASVLVVCLNEVLLLEPGIVGLLIVWASNYTLTLAYMVETFSEAEAAITAIERVDAMSKIPQEKPMKTDDEHRVTESWPSKGSLEFENVCLRYRDGLPLALNNLSFCIPPGKSCGVVGRTGAGKSSLTVALFRLVEIESGKITLDGVDLSTLGLSDVRGRANGMTIIPQDPFLVGSTLRECLDPFGESNEDEILAALNAVRLGKNSDDVPTSLDTIVQEGGSNYSVGERQLLNLARALLSKPRVLVLDEATASIDGETDAFIQQMLRTRFSDTTLITVAHRLNTIMDYDIILVMDAGQAVELGSPAELLSTRGVFSELVDATGPESARALRSMVRSGPDAS